MKRVFVAVALLLILFAMSAFGEAGYLLYSDDTPARVVAEVTIPEGFTCPSGESPAGEISEYYFLPTDGNSNVRFLYYTAGKGSPRTLAEAALSSYSMLYDEFNAGEIHEEDISGHPCLYFGYTCTYPNREGDAFVYEQTVVAYIPPDSGEFIACIVSFAFDDAGSYLTDEEMNEHLISALGAIQLSE